MVGIPGHFNLPEYYTCIALRPNLLPFAALAVLHIPTEPRLSQAVIGAGKQVMDQIPTP
jgi:hypothetical protein